MRAMVVCCHWQNAWKRLITGWADTIVDLAAGGLPDAAAALIPAPSRSHGARLDDHNPFNPMSANHDLVRATRLAWIEAAQEIFKEARALASRDDFRSQADRIEVYDAVVAEHLLQRRRACPQAGSRCRWSSAMPVRALAVCGSRGRREKVTSEAPRVAATVHSASWPWAGKWIRTACPVTLPRRSAGMRFRKVRLEEPSRYVGRGMGRATV